MARASLSSRAFGTLSTGETVEAWTISGSGGLAAEILAYGGIVRTLLAPGRDGRLDDMVLGFDELESYLTDRAYFGAVIGRIAGRVSEGRSFVDGKCYPLARNEGSNHLHGGFEGFHRKLWKATPLAQSRNPEFRDLEPRDGELRDRPSLRLEYFSPDGEEGYPGSVNVAVTYTITPENVLEIRSEATSDRPTPLSLTFHSYFNLAGAASGSIGDHELQIHADEFVAVDEKMTLLDDLRCVNNGNDFRRTRRMEDAIPELFRNHGDLYRIRKTAEEASSSGPVHAAQLSHRPSGRVMDVSTTATYLQLYTGVGLDGSVKGKQGIRYERHAGLCLECEGYPNGASKPAMGDILLHPGQVQREITRFAFRTM
jgi:aldose 1-epimerase